MSVLDKCKKGKVDAEGRVRTPWFRGSFMSVFHKVANKIDPSKPESYNLTMLFDESEVDISTLRKAAEKAAMERWGKTKGIRMPFIDGNTKEYDGWEDMIAVRSSTQYPPGVVDKRNCEIPPPGPNEDNPCYGGAYYRATLTTWTYDHPVGGKGVAFNFENIQKLMDGDRLGGSRQSAENAFDDLDDDDGIDPLS